MNKILIIFVCILLSCCFLYAENQTDPTDKPEHQSPGRRIADWLISRNVNPYAAVLIIAMLPIVELRGAIPAGIAMELDWAYVIIFSVIGNMIPIFFILFLLKPVERILRKIPLFDRFFTWLYRRTLRKSESVEKYEQLGLMFFVAIPLPVTGAWTGSLIAYLLKFRYFSSIALIFSGVCIAGFIVSAITWLAKLGFENYGYLGFSLVIGVVIAVFVFLTVRGNRAKNKPDL